MDSYIPKGEFITLYKYEDDNFRYLSVDDSDLTLKNGGYINSEKSKKRLPIIISKEGSFAALGSGELFDINASKYIATIPETFHDAVWTESNELISIYKEINDTVLEIRDNEMELIGRKNFSGSPLAIVGNKGKYVVVTVVGRAFKLNTFIPSDDNDGDGVDNTQDAFPGDPAASVDEDKDGYPDVWNEGHDESTSTTGLKLDEFPGNNDCFLPEHRDGSDCDYSKTDPQYIDPEAVAIDDNGIVYILNNSRNSDSNSYKIVRYDLENEKYLSSIPVGYKKILVHHDNG